MSSLGSEGAVRNWAERASALPGWLSENGQAANGRLATKINLDSCFSGPIFRSHVVIARLWKERHVLIT